MNKIKKPDISIILPTYNVGQHIDRCLESCSKQTHENIEIIVVDDCGNDDSIDKAGVWAARDTRIKIIANPKNLGTFHARRRGVEYAQGEYIIFLDPDDALHRDAAQEILSEIKKQSVDIVFFGIIQICKKNHSRSKNIFQCPPTITGDVAKDILRQKSIPLGTPGKAYRRTALYNALLKLPIPEDERLVYGEDALALFLVISNEPKGLSIKKYLYSYYVNESSITAQNSIEHVRSQQQQLDRVIYHLKKVASKKKDMNSAVLKYFIKKLKYDWHMIARYTLDEHAKDQYLKSIGSAFMERKTIKGLVRLLAYVTSLGKIRL